MTTFKIDMGADISSAPILDRIIEAYGFSQKTMLADHLGVASNTLSSRYKRGGFPADIVVRCMAETGVTLEWLATGEGQKFCATEEVGILSLPRKKIDGGSLQDAGMLKIDNAMFIDDNALPHDPICVVDGAIQYIIDRQFAELYDGKWMVEIEGKTSIRTLTLIPIKRVKVSGGSTSFDCSIDDITVVGRVVLTVT